MAAIDPQDAAELVALLGDPDRADPAPAPARDVRQLVFDQWAMEHSVRPGAALSLQGGQLYMHYLEWAASQGIDVTYKRREWGGLLKKRGLARGKNLRIDRHVWLMALNAAEYFRNWGKTHPLPNGGPWGFHPWWTGGGAHSGPQAGGVSPAEVGISSDVPPNPPSKK